MKTKKITLLEINELYGIEKLRAFSKVKEYAKNIDYEDLCNIIKNLKLDIVISDFKAIKKDKCIEFYILEHSFSQKFIQKMSENVNTFEYDLYMKNKLKEAEEKIKKEINALNDFYNSEEYLTQVAQEHNLIFFTNGNICGKEWEEVFEENDYVLPKNIEYFNNN